MDKEKMLNRLLEKIANEDYYKNPGGLIDCGVEIENYGISVEIDKALIELVYYSRDKENKRVQAISQISYMKRKKSIYTMGETEWMKDKFNEIMLLDELGTL